MKNDYKEYFKDREGEWIPSLEFRLRLSISRSNYLQAITDGRITQEVIGGKEYIEAITNKNKFIATAPNPNFYTEGAIVARRKMKEARRARDKEVKTARIRKKKHLPPLERHLSTGIIKENGEILSLHSGHLSETEMLELSAKEGTESGMYMDTLREPSDAEFHPAMARRESEAVKQLYLAKQAKLKFLKDAGVLMETEKIKQEWEAIAIAVRKTMLAIPDRVSELYASMMTADEIRNNLTKEIINSLSNLKYEMDRSNATKVQSKEEV